MKRDEFYIAFGQRVRAARKSAGMSQEELAKRTGLVRVSVSNIERGVSGTTVWRLARIAAACGLLPHQLLDPDYTLKPKKPYQVTEWR